MSRITKGGLRRFQSFLPPELTAKILKDAKVNKRSESGQINFILENYYYKIK